jgi:mitochondrial pyruvate carrier 2
VRWWWWKRRWRREAEEREREKERDDDGERARAQTENGTMLSFSFPLNPDHLLPKLNSRAPTFKWGITFANIADFSRPADSISTPQQCAVTATGVIWSRFATQIVPVNYNLLTVNAFMAMTGMYQLSRKFGLIESGPAAGAVAAVKEEVKKVSPA